MISEALKDSWDWLKTAPLPVVLALSLVSVGVAVRYTAIVHAEAMQRDKDLKTDVDKGDDQINKRLDHVDRQLAAVLEKLGKVEGWVDAQPKK